VEIRFDGQVVLVTGAATGLGAAVAESFGEAGGQIALNDLDAERVGPAVERLSAKGVACRGFPADVRDGSAVERMLNAIVEEMGVPAIVVSNAGLYPNSPFLELSGEEWDAVIDTNLKGTFLVCQAAARAMVKSGNPGAIVTISSGAAVNAIYGWSHYSASKAGVAALTKGMAIELAPHAIRVNSILPGYIDVEEGGRHLSSEYKAAARGGIPLGRRGEPADIAGAALMLASPLAGFVTGALLPVDGGSSAGRATLRPARASSGS